MQRSVRAGFVCLVLLVATTGCLDLVLGGTATFEASQATVSEDALDETGYELGNQTTDNVSRTYEVAGQERDVRVTNKIVTYERNASLGPLGDRDVGRFVVLSTPAVEVAGQTFNPVGDWSEKRLVSELSSQYSELGGVERVKNRSVDVLGEARSVEKFTGQATIAGEREVDVEVHVTKFRDGDDFVVGIGIYPQRLSGEQERIDTLLAGIQH